jgi:hypothetical protein
MAGIDGGSRKSDRRTSEPFERFDGSTSAFLCPPSDFLLPHHTVKPLQYTLPGALIEIVRRQPTTAEKVAFAWRTAVGPAVARASSVSLEGGVLRVGVEDAHWRREISCSLPLIRSRLEMLLGDAISSIAIQGPSR